MSDVDLDDHIRRLLEPLAPWEQAHVDNCAVCRGLRHDASEVAALAHGDLELAAVLWQARRLQERATMRVWGLRRKLNRRASS